MNDLTIIIVSWNCKGYLTECLGSIDVDRSKILRTVIVVDNNSSDGTPEMLRKDFPRVDVISNMENRGFAAANNQALKVSRSRFVLLLNPDTVVRSGALDTMVKFMDDRADVWAIGPTILNGDGSRQHSGVRFPTNWDILVEALFLDRLFPQTRLFGRHKEVYKDPERSDEVDYLQGSCLMVRSEAIERVGALDERFFMYFEETDWCFRMKKAGGTIRFCPSATVVHFGGNEIGHFDERRLVHYHRSLLRFYQKHYSVGRTAAARLILFLRSLIRIVVWCVFWVLKPGLRDKAASSVRGYVSTVGILFTPGHE
jgi:GT2 family glycosyltransferase